MVLEGLEDREVGQAGERRGQEVVMKISRPVRYRFQWALTMAMKDTTHFEKCDA
jgi:hypothetical protein